MSIKYICEQTAAEVEVTTISPLTNAPELPEGWNQEVTLMPSGELAVRHFATPEASLAWHQANDPAEE